MNFLISVLMIFSFSSLAGTGHGHSHGNGHSHGHGHSHGSKPSNFTAEQAKESAEGKIRVLIFQDKIDKSWEKAKFDKAAVKEFKGKKEWLVTFTNEKGVKGKKLYIFLKLNGEFVAANFTGK